MIFIVFCNIVFIFSIILIIFFCKADSELGVSLSVANAFIFGLGFFITGGLFLDTKIHENSYYASKVAQKEVYEYRLENEDFSINDYAELYKHIIEFNNEIITTREFRDSAWIGCFYNHKVGDIELIELPKRE